LGPPSIGGGGDELGDEQLPRAVNDAGQVFFDSFDQLLPGDTNKVQDVYEYDGTDVRLISPGTGAGPCSQPQGTGHRGSLQGNESAKIQILRGSHAALLDGI
jgi:hypothetical protein